MLKFFIAFFSIFLLSACSGPIEKNIIATTTDNSIQIENNKSLEPNDSNFCAQNESEFAKYSSFFEKQDFMNWCEQCLAGKGLPQISHDAGPFCNKKTKDGGQACSDGTQCEGYCLAKNNDDRSGACSEYTSLAPGCNWLELINGQTRQLCAD